MESISQPISPEKPTGFKRVGKHLNFVITEDLNMVQQVRVITLDTATSKPMTDLIEADETLTPAQRQASLQRYADQIVTRQTVGSLVNAAGQVVELGTEGAISQRDYFQAITLGDLKKMGLPISDKTPVTTLIYALIQGEIANIDHRGEL
ncbi:hypothetical protein GO755_39330 [Spirosoma sp. HMF4905]|uniref:Uncharacterized protein n=1 Tax=Spirosoma arboris TaxID=2682092 RepID=A0A7K1SQQ9_9BACT|nr:hypothetical protein [Spirosoma arboris]MVM36131.1 hypothetical protein [Spirosoma arboris]